MKYAVLSRMRKNGDSIIEFRDKDIEPILATTDFRNKYIRRVKGNKRFNYDKDNILVFDWTNYCFGIINPADVVYITPLAQMLKNQGPPQPEEYGVDNGQE